MTSLDHIENILLCKVSHHVFCDDSLIKDNWENIEIISSRDEYYRDAKTDEIYQYCTPDLLIRQGDDEADPDDLSTWEELEEAGIELEPINQQVLKYAIIDKFAADYLCTFTNQTVLYLEKYDLYFWAVTHPTSSVITTIQNEKEGKNE